jgi:50S ribosomal subunit-associated GTPase HflX
MSLTEVVVEGTLKPDGTLELDQKPNLPAGRVQVIVIPRPELPRDDPFWQRMQAIWNGQKARGFVPRSVEEVEAERRQVRDEWEERMQRLEQIRAEAEAIRKARE